MYNNIETTKNQHECTHAEISITRLLPENIMIEVKVYV